MKHLIKKIIVQTNIDKLAQVFINLIENAISFSPAKSNIIIQQVIEKNYVIVYISDQGIGINLNLSEKIFQRFYTDRPKNTSYHYRIGIINFKKNYGKFWWLTRTKRKFNSWI